MKTLTLPLLLLALAASPFWEAAAQSCDPADTLDHWVSHQVPPAAAGDVFYYLCDVVDEQAIWGMDFFGQFCRSTDGGCTWTTGATSDAVDANVNSFSLTATSADEAWVVFYDNNEVQGRILHTTDGGLSWDNPFPAEAFTLPGGFADMVHFFDPLNGVALGDVTDGYFEIWTTADGGAAWTRVPSANIPAPAGDEAFFWADNYATFGNTIWASTAAGRCLKSEDFGLTWTASTIFPFVSGNSAGSMIAFRDELHGLVGTDFGIFATEDGGGSWMQAESDLAALNTFVLRSVPGTSLFLTGGAFPGTYLTQDDGETWHTLNTFHNEPEFFSPALGWAANGNAPNSMLEWRGKTVLATLGRLSLAQVTVRQAAATGQLSGSLLDFASGGTGVEVDWKVLRDGIQVAAETDEVALPAGGSADAEFSYLPVATGEHVFGATGSLAGGDVVFEGEETLLVTDSTISKADNSSDIPEYAFGQGFTYGPEFVLPEPDTLTSMELFYAGSFQGGPEDGTVRFVAYDLPATGGQPGLALYTSPPVPFSASDAGNWVPHYIAGGLPLAAGRYVFSFRLAFSGDGRSLGGDAEHAEGTTWSNDGSGWFFFENDANATMLRMNFNPAGLPVAAQAVENEQFVHVFPNPAAGSLTVEGQARTASPLRLEVFDAFGRLHQTLEMETAADGRFRQALDVSALPAGVVLVKMTDGEKSWSARVAKQ